MEIRNIFIVYRPLPNHKGIYHGEKIEKYFKELVIVNISLKVTVIQMSVNNKWMSINMIFLMLVSQWIMTISVNLQSNL